MIESNDIKILIEDIVVPTKGVGKYFSIKTVNHVILGTPPVFYWQVCTQVVESASESDEQPLKYPGASVLDGNLSMTIEEYDLWGTDDNYVVDWALEKLNFTKI